MKTTKQLSQFISTFNKALYTKNLTFIATYFFDLEKFLDVLYFNGYIQGYRQFTIENVKKIEVFVKYSCDNKCVVKYVKNTTRPSRLVLARVSQLRQESAVSTEKLGIIRTQKMGLITTQMALKNKCGGIYLVKIQ
jgi:ribosomal protein S8